MMGQNGRVALVVVGRLSGKGGAGMRWSALRSALGTPAEPVLVEEIACDRQQVCREVCAATGARSQPCPPDRYFDRASCADNADALVRSLRAAGAGTVVFSGLDTYRYVAQLAARREFRLVYDMHNVESVLYRTIAAATAAEPRYAAVFTEANLRLLESFERTAISAADEVWTCSEDDRRLAVATYPEAADRPIRIVPNVMEPPFSAPPAGPPERVSFTGRMEYLPNTLAARFLVDEIAPHLARAGCPLPVVLSGSRLDAQFTGRTLPPNVRLDSDPADTAQVIRGSVMVVPLSLGSGSRFKILEAFALGAPVVSTAKGVEGLEVAVGTHYLAAESPAEFTDAVLALSRNATLRAGVVSAARQLLVDRYSVTALRQRFRQAGVAH